MISNNYKNAFSTSTCLNNNSRQVSPNFKGKKHKLIPPTNTNLQASLGETNLRLLDSIRQAAKEEGRDIFLFGGGVRDCLLGNTPHDLDLVVNGDALEFTQNLHKKNPELFTDYKLKPHVNRAVIHTKDMSIDINPLLKDGSFAQGKDAVRKGLLTKSKGCDFSMNALFIKLGENKEGGLKLKLFNLIGGKTDLKNKTLRGLSNKAFEDNPVNVLRALRFKMKYGMTITPETEEILQRNAKNPVNKGNNYYHRLHRDFRRMFREAKNPFECFVLAAKHHIFGMLFK